MGGDNKARWAGCLLKLKLKCSLALLKYLGGQTIGDIGGAQESFVGRVDGAMTMSVPGAVARCGRKEAGTKRWGGERRLGVGSICPDGEIGENAFLR